MRKNKLYFFLSILTIIFLFSFAALCTQWGTAAEKEKIGVEGEEEVAAEEEAVEEEAVTEEEVTDEEEAEEEAAEDEEETVVEPTEYKLLQSWGSMGSGDGQFNYPCGIAVDEKEQIYIADTGSQCIQKLTADGQFLARWGTSGQPIAVVVDASGNVYVAEGSSDIVGLIEKFTPEGTLIKKWEYQGSEYTTSDDTVYRYSTPGGIATSGDYVYLGNNSKGRIDKFTLDGELVKSWGNFSVCCGFLDVAVDSQGNIYVAELGAFRVQVFDADGNPLRSWGKEGQGQGEFSECCNPVHIAVGPQNWIFTSEKVHPRIQVFSTDGNCLHTFGEEVFSEACGYVDLAVSSLGKLYVLDDATCHILVFGKEQ